MKFFIRKENPALLNFSGIAALALFTGAFSAPSQAYDEAERRHNVRSIEEVVVIARRREENLQDVPVAITAVTGADIERQGLLSLQDMTVPGLAYAPSGTSSGSFFIRGIGQNNSAITFESGVGLYIDGVYRGRTQGASLELFDLERVEVLRGPQGTLFGRNTIGGAINLISKGPEEELSGHIEAGVGNLGRREASASLNLPLVPGKVHSRFSVNYIDVDGYTKDYITGHESDDYNFLGFRGAVDYLATDDLKISIVADVQKRDQESSGAQCVLGDPSTRILQIINQRLADRGDPSFNAACLASQVRGKDYNTLGDWGADHSKEKSTEYGVALTADWNLGDTISIKSISSYRNLEQDQFLDIDATPLVVIDIDRNVPRHEQVSQEFQFSGTGLGERLNYTTGVYYYRDSSRRSNRSSSLLGCGLRCNSDEQKNTRESYALFGQATYDITEAFSFTAGARYTIEKVSYKGVSGVYPQNGSPLIINNVVDDISARFSSFDHLISAAYKFTDDIMSYISWSTGFKSGGFNTDEVPGFNAEFEPEEVDTYEIGLKSTLLNSYANLNIALFYSDYTDQQQSVQVRTAETEVRPLFTNAGESTIKGAEVEAALHLTDSWRVGGTYAYTDAKYNKFDSIDQVTQEPISLSNREMPNVPEHQASLESEWVFSEPFPFISEVRPSVYVNYISSVYADVTNSSVLFREGHTTWGASVAVLFSDEKTTLRFWGRNLSDRRTFSWGEDFRGSLGYAFVAWSPPRTFGVTLNRQF